MALGQTKTVGDTATLTGETSTGSVSFPLDGDALCKDAATGVSGSAALESSGVATSPASFVADHPGRQVCIGCNPRLLQ
jgi:hypothetical protein